MYFLGGYDKEEKAARAYDLAALKYWGPTTTTNFPVSLQNLLKKKIFIVIIIFFYIEVWIWPYELFIFGFLKVCNYEKELEEMKNMTRQEFVASLRR